MTQFYGTIYSWDVESGKGKIQLQNNEFIAFDIQDFYFDKNEEMDIVEIGDIVHFRLGVDEDGYPQAKQIHYQEWKPHTYTPHDEYRQRRLLQQNSQTWLFCLPYLAMVLLWANHRLPAILLFWYGLMGALAFLTYGKDKRITRSNKQAGIEKRLHLLSLLGGWVGALPARVYYHHKRYNTAFRTTFWITTLVNIAGLCFLLLAPIMKDWLELLFLMTVRF